MSDDAPVVLEITFQPCGDGSDKSFVLVGWFGAPHEDRDCIGMILSALLVDDNARQSLIQSFGMALVRAYGCGNEVLHVSREVATEVFFKSHAKN